MSQADALQRRVETFADRSLRFIQGLPHTQIAQRMAAQFQDASSSVASNYRAARRGRSYREFTAKIGVVSEEADESVSPRPPRGGTGRSSCQFQMAQMLPSPNQQLGLILLLAALVLYVLARA